MRISEDRLNALYKAIYDPITELRVENYELFLPLGNDVDNQLFNLGVEIFAKVRLALNIKY